MSPSSKPRSLVAERAVRYLRERSRPTSSVTLVEALLATQAPDEAAATRVLRAAFDGDRRLAYGPGGWFLAAAAAEAGPLAESDRVMILLHGGRQARGAPWLLRSLSVVRLRGGDVVAACGGEALPGAPSSHLRRAVRRTIEGAVAVIHDPPGSIGAFERWLGEELRSPLSLRRIGQLRLGLPAGHELSELAARLGITWRETEDPLEQADALDACLERLLRPGEKLEQLHAASTVGAKPIDWSRLAFDRSFLRGIPAVPGTYRFLDAQGGLLYVGKARNLHRRIASYFREGDRRSERVQSLLDRLHRVEYEHSGSDLEAVLREAEQIRTDEPEANVQRRYHVREPRGTRLASILILDQAEAPFVLRAYLIHRGRLIGRVSIGPRGGGLARIRRLLDDHFFFVPDGPTPAVGPDLDVEIVVRWLAANRERVVAFDPTDLGSSREVTDRLRWFLQSTLLDSDGSPIVPR